MPHSIARWFSPHYTLSQRLVVAGPPVLLAAFFLLPPPEGNGTSLAGLPSLCTFHNVTGLPCPGCGITRSLVCCAHGLIGQAFRFHPLGPLVFLVLIGMTLMSVVSAARPGIRLILPPQWINGAAWTGIAALGIIWAGRLSGVLPAPP